MYYIRVKKWNSAGYYVWQLLCSAHHVIAQGNTFYTNKGLATHWAKYWAKKLSLEGIEFKEEK
ncbi:hypothetical protein LCGC14_1627230 [marine sediment metagenome]|uniref:Uncharacterized protein n=1 Tax=marine sediment metagenome TaxID=412755 RepID=A0A0F9L3E6_9ZZZZ